MKPSDTSSARVCVECHSKYDLKRRGLIKSGYEDVLDRFQHDALILLREYVRHLESYKRRSLPAERCGGCAFCRDGECEAKLEHVEPPNECALDELNIWLVTEAQGLGPDEQRDWLLSWSNRRSANVLSFLAEPMLEIATETSDESSRFVAKRALRTACLGGADGKDEDRLVR